MTEQELQDKAKDLAKNVPLRTDTPYPEMIRYFLASMYLRGYDDGKNDASRWHYPSKGELPPTNIEVLLCLQTEKGQECIVGERTANNDMLEGGGYCWCWFDFGRMGFIEFVDERESIEVVAWQYIVPPKEEA